LSRNPCGSSSGTGAAISAALAAVGVGTETNGSIICPSVRCGLVGIKPTLGLVSRSGIIPISHSQDTAGPMARTVSDAAILLGVLAGKDAADATTSRGRGQRDYTKFLDKNGLKGAKIGVARQFLGRNPASNAQFEAHLQVLKDGGASLVDVTFTLPDTFGDDETEVLLFEFKAGVNAYLAARNSPYKSLTDLIAFNETNKEREMPLFGQELFLQAQKRGDLTSEKYLAALHRLKSATQAQGIDAVVAKDGLSAIVSPTGGGTWGMAAVAGYPYITVPAGFAGGLPTGIGFFGAAFSEPQLLKIAYAFEQKTRARQTPKYLPSV
jgi:amidase